MRQRMMGRSLLDIETVAMISSHDNESVFIDAELLEVLNRGANGVVKLEELTKSALVVKDVHLRISFSYQ